jgi:hypothetical protein
MDRKDSIIIIGGGLGGLTTASAPTSFTRWIAWA